MVRAKGGAGRARLGVEGLEARDVPAITSIGMPGWYLSVRVDDASTAVWIRSTPAGQVTVLDDLGRTWSFYRVSSVHVETGSGHNLIDASGLGPIPIAVITGAGHDTVYGGSGLDFLSTGAGNDHVFAGAGGGPVNGGDGGDRLYGGAGRDQFYGGGGNDSIEGGGGDDAIVDYRGDNTIRGGAGHDSLVGGLGDDRLYGDAGHDTLIGYEGADWLDGGFGDDLLKADDSGRSDTLVGGPGQDTLVANRVQVWFITLASDTLLDRSWEDAVVWK